MEGRIRQLEHLLETSEIIEGGADGVVAAGSIVTIVYEGDTRDMAERYLVGHMEEKAGGLDVISPASPLGSALLGAKPGDVVQFDAPSGTLPRRGRRGGVRLSATQEAPRRAEPPPGRRRRAARARHHVRPSHERPGRCADGAAAARLDGERRPQLVHLLPRAQPPLPRARHRPPRPRAGDPQPAHVPAGGLRRRRRRAVPGARDRAGDPRRLLDGRSDRPADVAPPPQAGARARALRDLGVLPDVTGGAARLPRPHRARRRRPADPAAGPALADRAALPEGQGGHVGAVGAAAGGPARLADGARSRQGDRLVRRSPVDRRRRRARRGRDHDPRPGRAGAAPDPAVPGDPELRGVPGRR